MYYNLPNPIEEFKAYAGRRVAIPMSGGADSALLAACAIGAGCNVDLIRLKAATPTSTDEERLSDVLDSELKELANQNGVTLTVRKHIVNDKTDNDSACYVQMSWWLSAIPHTLPYECDAVAMGWLATDGTMQLSGDFADAIRAMRRCAWNRDVGVLFPLGTWSKNHVLGELKKTYPNIAKLVWWCENGAVWSLQINNEARAAFGYESSGKYHEQCGKCHSCVDTLAFFTVWSGDKNDNASGFQPMAAPPHDWLSKYPTITIPTDTMLTALRVIVSDIDQEAVIASMVKPPYEVTAKHAFLKYNNRTIPTVDAMTAIMERHKYPGNYQRCIEHLAFYIYGYLKKSNVRELKEIAQTLQARTDELWPVPDWYKG